MNEIKIYPIGKIENKEESICVKFDPKYAEGLKGLDGYSHVQFQFDTSKIKSRIRFLDQILDYLF